MSESVMPLPDDLPSLESSPPGIVEGYRILERIGQGGMGMVFRAEDVKLGRIVSIKMMKDTLANDMAGRKRFLREARAMAAIKNDHVVTIYQVGEVRDVPFIVMEFLHGYTLETRCRIGSLQLREFLRIGIELSMALAAVHNAGILHRDLKPDNVWLEAPNGRVKLLDMGLARISDGPDREAGSISGVTVGTPHYMSPEQAFAKNLDTRSDLFSLGVVFYRMLTGALPFQGESTLAVLNAITTQRPKPIRNEVPIRLRQLIDRLLAKNPNDRPISAEAVVSELTGILAMQDNPDVNASPLPANLILPANTSSVLTLLAKIPVQVVRNHRKPMIAVGVISAFLTMVIYYAIWSMNHATPNPTDNTASPATSGIPLNPPLPATTPQTPPTQYKASEYHNLFNKVDLKGWKPIAAQPDRWNVKEDVLIASTFPTSKGDAWLLSDLEFEDFELRVNYRAFTLGAHTSIRLRAREENNSVEGIAVNIGDDEGYQKATGKPLGPYYQTGVVQFFPKSFPTYHNPPGEPNTVNILARGRELKIFHNGKLLNQVNLDQPDPGAVKAGFNLEFLKRPKGAIALEAHTGVIEYRSVELTELKR